jgi:ATP-dependent DNA helicase RecG
MFGKTPGIEIQMAIFATKEKLTFNDIYRTEGRILDLVDTAERYIRNTMRYRVIIDGTQIARKEIPEVPHIAIREALLNSFCHKNYRTPQNNEVAIYSDRIEIYNPGVFPENIDPDDFIKGVGQSVHRNPLLARIMYYSKDIENFGTGLKRIADACEEAGIKYEFVKGKLGFTVVFYRPPLWTSDRLEDNIRDNTVNDENITESITESITENIAENETQRIILAQMKKNPKITSKSLAETLGIAERNVKNHIKALKQSELIERVGPDRGGHWKVRNGG